MKVLAIDTATEACSAALSVDGQVSARFEIVDRSHTERLMPMVLGLMADAGLAFSQLDGYVCGIGPGSFAGVRIGVGYVKGLALAVDRPVAPVSSLAMLAWPALEAGAAQVVAAIDARMSEVYFGAYRHGDEGGASPLLADSVCAPAQAPRLGAGRWHAVGTAWGRYEAELRTATAADLIGVEPTALPRAQDGLALGLPVLASGRGICADALAPAYLRDKVALTLDEQQALRRNR